MTRLPFPTPGPAPTRWSPLRVRPSSLKPHPSHPPIGGKNSRLATSSRPRQLTHLLHSACEPNNADQTIPRVPALRPNIIIEPPPSCRRAQVRQVAAWRESRPAFPALSPLVAAGRFGRAKPPGQANTHMQWPSRAKSRCRPAPSMHAVYPLAPSRSAGQLTALLSLPRGHPPISALKWLIVRLHPTLIFCHASLAMSLDGAQRSSSRQSAALVNHVFNEDPNERDTQETNLDVVEVKF